MNETFALGLGWRSLKQTSVVCGNRKDGVELTLLPLSFRAYGEGKKEKACVQLGWLLTCECKSNFFLVH